MPNNSITSQLLGRNVSTSGGSSKPELSNWEEFQNIFSNAGRGLQQAFYSTQVASLELSDYLGLGNEFMIDNLINEKYSEIQDLNERMESTGKGIVGGFEEGDLADIALGMTNALTSVVTTVVPAIATRGASLVPQIMAPMYTEYNLEKAKMLYGDNTEESIKMLLDNEEDEVAIPMALGLTSVALEKIGIKGISNYVLNNVRTSAARKIGNLVLTGSREGLTEYFQGGLNVANKSFAQGDDINTVNKKVFSHLGSKDALEEFLQGFVGGAGMSATGLAINKAFRDDKDNLIINDYINVLGSLNQQKVNSKTEEAKSAIDKKIKKTEKDLKNFLILNQKKSEYLTEDQSKEIVNILDNKNKLESKVQDLQKQVKNGEINQDEYNLIIEDIKEQVELGNKNLNDIKVEANKKKLHEDLRTSEDAISGIKGLTQKVYKTPDEFLKAINSKSKKQYTLEDLQNVDGLIVDGEIMINETVAAETNAITVGSHELLHGIVKSSLNGEVRTIKDSNGNSVDVDITVEGAKLIKEFLSTLNAKETKVVQKRIDDNYRYNRDKNGKIISEKAFEQYAEEYLNAYADAAIKNELSDSVLVKIGKFLSKIFNSGDKGYKNLEFKTGKDVKEFLKAYVSDRKKGKFRQQFVEMAQEGAKTKTVINKESRSKAVDAVNKMEQGAETKAEFQKPGIFNNIYNSIVKENGAINNYVKSLGLSKEKFQETIDSLSDRLMNYDPASKRKTDSGEPVTIGEFLMSNIGFAKLDAAKKLAIEGKKEGKTTRIDAAKKTKEGETTFDIEDTSVTEEQKSEEQDISPQAEVKKKADAKKAKEKKYSKFRQQLGIETGSDLYNKVIDTAKKALITAYELGTSVRNIQRKLRDEAAVYLFKDIKNLLGTKKYISNLKEYRTFIVDAIFTADLVQLEKMVPENERVFTVFDRELTSKADVEAAVEQGLLPKEALNVIDKGNSVRLYRKVIPTEKQFVAFFDQPAINPKTGVRSGLKGTRKDALAKAIAGSLSFDATMEVAQDPEVAQMRQDIAELNNETLANDDIQQLASFIGRNPNIKFSMSNVDKNILDHVYELVQDIDNGKRKLKNIVGSKDGKDFLKIDIKRKKSYKALNRNIAIDDKNFIAKTVKDIVNSNQYGKLKDAKLEKQYIEDIITARKKGKSLKMGDIHENTFRDQFVGLLKNINNKIQSVKAKGDIYFSNGITTLGIEIKLNLARGISQTINFAKGKAIFTNKNETVSHRDENTTYDNEIGVLTEEQYGLVERLFVDNGLGKIADNQILTEEQANVLKQVKSLFTSRITMNNTDYISWGYSNGKYASAVQGMIEIGQSMFNLNNSEISNNVVNDYNTKNPNDQIKGLKLKDGKEITMISYVQIGKNNKLTFRTAPLLNDTDFVSSSNVRTKSNSKILAKSIDNSLTNFRKSQAMSNIDNIVRFSRSVNNPTKGISILDFDDTLATTKSKIRFTKPDGTEGTLTPEQYASTYQDLLGLDYKFDFSEFNKVVDGKPAPLLNKAKKLAGKFGTDNMFILTARPAESAVAIQKFLKENGLDIPLKNITGLGNSTADAKALWVLDKAAEGYNDFYFADDAIQNVKAVQNMLDQIDVKSKVQQARVKFSKSMDKDFNDVLEDISGIESNKRFSEAKARRRGKRKGKFRFFVPPSHEDFIGLLYNFMGRGEKGNQHRNFFEQSLVRPLNRAYRELNAAKQAIANDYRALIKSMPDVRKKLGKKILDGDFTNEDAIRVYLWDKFGLKIPGISKTDQKNLVEFVKSDPEMQEFADKLGRISKDEKGYVQPSDNWDAGGIKYDLIDATGRIGRAKFFQEFIENAGIIFSEKNLNKIQAIYGEDFRSALEDMLYRVTKGTNRPTGKNKLVNRWLDWINGSVGATMFFNARSAVLQQLSFVNFMNFADNNVFKAAARFADQKQFWSDFAMIFNSDYLKQRRSGAGFDVSSSEIAREVSNAKDPVSAAIRYILNKGFLPTQMGDSFAIAIGGASFLRNRINTYLKQGLTKKEAEAKAFIDFQQIAEATQQSARPDMISQQQASVLGRFILAFQNVTSQYARIVKKSGIDLVKRRKSPGYVTQAQSDMANVSRIMYYGAIQSMIFYGLQSALFAMMFDDDEQDEEFFDKKKDRILNGTLDSLLRGMGVGGAVVSTIKNYVVKLVDNSKSDAYFKSPAWPELLQISPPIGIKVRKFSAGERTADWNMDAMKEMETFDIDNPGWDAVTNIIEAATNVPLNRLHRKVQNLRAASDSENAWWQRVAVTLGWNKWDVGIPDREIEEIKKGLKGNKKSQSTIPNKEAQESENKEKQKQERKQNKKVICAGVTSKGSRCKKEIESGTSYCTIHAKVAKNKSGKKTQCKKMKQVSKKKRERCGMMTNSKSGYCYYHD
jgi:hypothetical protein